LELNNAVREGVRYAQVNPGETTNIKNRVLEKSPGLTGMGYRNISIECIGGCTADSTEVKVTATYEFTAITQELLGIGPITLTSSAEAEIK
jgi:hypothetical protein